MSSPESTYTSATLPESLESSLGEFFQPSKIKQPKRSNRLCRLGLPVDLISRIIALRHPASDDGGESFVVDGDLLDLLMRARGGDDSADDDGDSGGEPTANPVDCRVN